MTVAFNSPLTSANVNSKFMSKTSDTGTTGKINQTNTTDATNSTDGALHTDGGASVAKKLFVGDEIQADKFVNVNKTFSAESISNAGNITISERQAFQTRRLVGNGSAVITATTPFGSLANLLDGSIVLLIGTDDTNTVTIPENDIQYGCYINGLAELKKGYVLGLIYDATSERLYELFRSF